MQFKPLYYNTKWIGPNYWDFICKKTFTIKLSYRTHEIETYLVPLWIANAVKLLFKDSDFVLYKACAWGSYGVYTKTRIDSSYIGFLLKKKEEPLRAILLEKGMKCYG